MFQFLHGKTCFRYKEEIIGLYIKLLNVSKYVQRQQEMTKQYNAIHYEYTQFSLLKVATKRWTLHLYYV